MLNIAAFTDPILNEDSLFKQEHVWHQDKPVLLVYASCHGRTLIDYFRTRPDFMAAYNIIRLETGPMLTAMNLKKDPNLCNRDSIRQIFQMADVIVTYNMGARHRDLSLEVVGKHFTPGAKVITFVAPNFSCFCPFGYGYTSTMPILNALDKGKTPTDVWDDFTHGQLDCLFPMRWRFEMGRLADKESYHDIGLTQFIQRNHKKAKLWSAPSHPTFLPMAYVGNEVCIRLGLPAQSEESIMAMDYKLGWMRGQPETNYEFNHFKFEYPSLHQSELGEYYSPMFTSIVNYWNSGGLLMPAVD